MEINLFTVIGCRPQFIKASAFSRKVNANSNNSNFIKETIIHTGQHFDINMSEKFFQELEIPTPKFNCKVSNGTHGENTGKMIERIEKIIINLELDYLLVYGDTDSTLAGALAASKLGIPIIHIEAGLRSFNRKQPEEQNRILTDHLSEICFVPTKTAYQNLLREGISEERIALVGDLMEDMNIFFSNKASNNIKLLRKLRLKEKDYALVTIHREENTKDQFILENILRTLNQLEIRIIFPLHPGTKRQIKKYNLGNYLNNIEFIEPVGFIDMSTLEKNARIILTDSGGVQKEAFFHKVPCITLRGETEWLELVNSGWNKLANPLDHNSIIKAFNTQLKFERDRPIQKFYGDGNSAQKIYDFIISKKIADYK